ncbi:YihY/virulence factor BrkB family protein [Primorskyibacter flagellatus]|uniref:Membrane protein n=1 Tax=Primorskyibacter flagellatus TaxID=1387277 RepID=A0A1W1YX77_9RHOB|nr:YihY/virulence factor BrkB family protein [Primorskyibacter flagellatus]SMC40810.1 membrane protein [Primorskyibacter flagellatus]
MDRGHDAQTPTQIPLRGWWDILKRVYNGMLEDNLGLIAAGCAFYGLLALFPAITAIMAIAGLVSQPDIVVEQLSAITEGLPENAASIMIDQAAEVAGASSSGLTFAAWIGFALAVYSASLAVQALMQGLNVAFGEAEKRSIVRIYFMRVVLTLGLIFGFLMAVAAVVALPVALSYLAVGPVTDWLAQVLRWPLLLVAAGLGIALLFRWGPSRTPARWRWITPGVLLSCVLWVAGTLAFSYYARNFAGYNETFGALSGVIVLLMWMWVSAFIILLGAELDAETEAQTAQDTTVGPTRRLGRRGARAANRVGGVAVDNEPPPEHIGQV